MDAPRGLWAEFIISISEVIIRRATRVITTVVQGPGKDKDEQFRPLMREASEYGQVTVVHPWNSPNPKFYFSGTIIPLGQIWGVIWEKVVIEKKIK